MRRNWAATVLVVSVSVLCAPAPAGSARPPLSVNALSPGLLKIHAEQIGPFVAQATDEKLSSLNALNLNTGQQKRLKATMYGDNIILPDSPTRTLARERSFIARRIGRLKFGGMALRRVRPGQLLRPTESAAGQDLHMRAGVFYHVAPHWDVTSEVLYIQPATQSLYVRRARAPLQAGIGSRVTTPIVSLLFSGGVGMAQWGGSLKPGLFILLTPGAAIETRKW